MEHFNLQQDLSIQEQLHYAKTGSADIQKALLEYPKLSGDALVELCQFPRNLNLLEESVKSRYTEAIMRTLLTPIQQVKISTISNNTFQTALLLRSNLSYEALLRICQSPARFAFDIDTVKTMFESATRNLIPALNKEQKLHLALTGNEGVLRALIP